MILANLGSIYKECLGDATYDKQIDEAVDKVLNCFWNEEHQVLFENVKSDYQPDLTSSDGRHIIPGHGLESMWFILQYVQNSGKKELIPKICKIIKALLKFGWDKEYGGLYYFMDVLGKPQPALEWDMKLWWVHNEAILACLYGFEASNDEELVDWFQKVDKWSFQHFPDSKYGEWYGYLNRRGEPTHLLKGGRWKTFFHLPRFLLFAINLMKIISNC